MSLTLQAHQTALDDREERWALAQEQASRRDEDRIAIAMETWRRERRGREAAEREAETVRRTREMELLFQAIPRATAARLQAQELEWQEESGEKDPFATQPPSPPDDQVQFAGLIQRAASTFRIPLQRVEGPASYLLEKLSDPMRASTCLPVDPLIWDKGLHLMARPASVPPTNDRQERKLRAPASDPLCLRGMPPVDRAVAQATTGEAPAGASPPSRPLDILGQRMCTTAALAVREANATAVLARYQRELWDSVEPFLHHLPEEQKRAAQGVLSEGRLCADHAVRMALDSSDTAFRSMAHGVTLRRRGCLLGSPIEGPARARLVNLPFTGQELFGDGAGCILARPPDHSAEAAAVPSQEEHARARATRRARNRHSTAIMAQCLGFKGYARRRRRTTTSAASPAEGQ